MNVREDLKSVMKSIRDDLENATQDGKEIIGYGLVLIAHDFETNKGRAIKLISISPELCSKSQESVEMRILESFAAAQNVGTQ